MNEQLQFSSIELRHGYTAAQNAEPKITALLVQGYRSPILCERIPLSKPWTALIADYGRRSVGMDTREVCDLPRASSGCRVSIDWRM